MSVVTYTANARATLIVGHTAGSVYSFEMPFMQHEKSYGSPKSQPRAIGGTIETILQRVDDNLSLEIGLYDSSDEAQVEEFIKSVAGGETFSVDLNGTIATPSSPVDVKLVDKSNAPTRYGPRTYSLPFNVSVV